MKIIKYIFLVIWTLWSILGIIGNYSRYKFVDWIFIILFVAMPYLILWYIAHRKTKRRKEKGENLIEDTVTTANSTINISSGNMSLT